MLLLMRLREVGVVGVCTGVAAFTVVQHTVALVTATGANHHQLTPANNFLLIQI